MLTSLLLTEKERAAIGDVVVESARLESVIEVCVSVVGRLSKDTHATFLGGNLVGENLDLLKELGERKLTAKSKKAKKDAFTDLIGRVRGLITERNTLVHGLLQPKGGFHKVFITGPDARIPYEVVQYTRKGVRRLDLGRVLRLAAEIDKATSDIWKFSLAECGIRPRKTKPKVP